VAEPKDRYKSRARGPIGPPAAAPSYALARSEHAQDGGVKMQAVASEVWQVWKLEVPVR
jgi:hypothetical protein